MNNDNLPPLCGTLKRTFPSLTEESHERFVRAYGQACYAAGQRDAVAASGAGVLDGWKLVPILATNEMVKAAYGLDLQIACWDAMLAAAPTPDRATKAEAPTGDHP